MTSTIDQEKRELRRQVRQRIGALDREELRRSDDALFARFLALPQVREARTVFAFWGVPGREPDTARLISGLLSEGKRVGLPRMLPGHRMEVRAYSPARPLVPASCGILEPGEDCPLLSREEIGLVLVPAVCYDRRGYRLGFGGGYYDRWLEGFGGLRVGLCRSVVLQAEVPVEAHDSRVDILLTEEESLSFPQRRGGAGERSPAHIT